MCVCVCVCVCVPTPRPLITSGVIGILYDWINNSCCFSVPIYAITINIKDGRGLSNDQLQPKKSSC